MDPPTREVTVARPGEPALVRHRQTYVAPTEEVPLDSTHLPSIPPHRTE